MALPPLVVEREDRKPMCSWKIIAAIVFIIGWVSLFIVWLILFIKSNK